MPASQAAMTPGGSLAAGGEEEPQSATQYAMVGRDPDRDVAGLLMIGMALIGLATFTFANYRAGADARRWDVDDARLVPAPRTAY